jgi:hypothetical protein
MSKNLNSNSANADADDLCTETLTIRIDARTLRLIEGLADANNLKRSEYIRDILRIAAENRLKITYQIDSFPKANF